MLVLFDIDGTLLTSGGAGTQSMLEAARELFGDHFTFDGVEIAGRIDPLIWADVAAANGIADPAAHHERFRATYVRHLTRRLQAGASVRLLPGVRPLLETLSAAEGVTLGVLTGNYPESGRLKIEAAGLDPGIFEVAAWGCDGRSRRELPDRALEALRDLGREVGPGQIVIVGDTPHDVQCARACGGRALAVATGAFGSQALAASEPDLLLDDLSATDDVLAWILRPLRAARIDG